MGVFFEFITSEFLYLLSWRSVVPTSISVVLYFISHSLLQGRFDDACVLLIFFAIAGGLFWDILHMATKKYREKKQESGQDQN